MSVGTEHALENLVHRQWSRDVVVDEDGTYLASVPELEGCFAAGDTVESALDELNDVLREWLAIALEEGTSIPEPRIQATGEFSGRFSVRLPRSLHRSLSNRADAEGCSLNQLVTALLSKGVHDPLARRESRTETHETIAADAVTPGRESIGALKGIATFLRDAGDLNLACLLFAFASERIAAVEGNEAASRELGTAAALARRNARVQLAESLWRESLRRDPTNLRSSSSLGQQLHHQGRYDEAIELLESASQVDNYALLFLGWSLLLRGKDSDDLESISRGGASIRKALEKWSYQNRDRIQREAWLRHIRRLSRLGAEWGDTVHALISFANSNASWPPIDDTALYQADELTSADEAAIA